MRAVIQRVIHASVSVDRKEISKIDKGLLVFVGFKKGDSLKDLDFMAEKISGLRVFPEGDKEGVHSVKDIDGEILLISQFTLYGDTAKGKRPSFSTAMPADEARQFYQIFADKLKDKKVPVRLGVFQASMQVQLLNDGPYTIILESRDTGDNV